MTTLTAALEHSPGSLLVSRPHVDLRRQASAICPEHVRPGHTHPGHVQLGHVRLGRAPTA